MRGGRPRHVLPPRLHRGDGPRRFRRRHRPAKPIPGAGLHGNQHHGNHCRSAARRSLSLPNCVLRFRAPAGAPDGPRSAPRCAEHRPRARRFPGCRPCCRRGSHRGRSRGPHHCLEPPVRCHGRVQVHRTACRKYPMTRRGSAAGERRHLLERAPRPAHRSRERTSAQGLWSPTSAASPRPSTCLDSPRLPAFPGPGCPPVYVPAQPWRRSSSHRQQSHLTSCWSLLFYKLFTSMQPRPADRPSRPAAGGISPGDACGDMVTGPCAARGTGPPRGPGRLRCPGP